MPIPPPSFQRFSRIFISLPRKLDTLKSDKNYLTLITTGLPAVDDPSYPQLNNALTQIVKKLSDLESNLLKALKDLNAIEINQIKYNLSKQHEIKQLKETCDKYRTDLKRVSEKINAFFGTLLRDRPIQKMLEIFADSFSKSKDWQSLSTEKLETQLKSSLQQSSTEVPQQRQIPPSILLLSLQIWVLAMCVLVSFKTKK